MHPTRIGAATAAAALALGVFTNARAEPQHDRGGTLVAQTTATHARVHSDRRPMGAGLYDRKADRTYVSWMGKDSDAYFQDYDHKGGRWSTPVKIGSSFKDKHNYPVMVQADDGKLLVFHGAHNSPLRLATRAADGTWSDRGLGDVAPYYASYPMALKARNGDVYVFFRDTLKEDDKTAFVDDRPMQYLMSTDDGVTWKSSGELTGHPYILGSERADNMDEVYVAEMTEYGGRFHMLWTMAGGGKPDVHGHGTQIHDVFYAVFDPATRHFSTVTGEDLGTQLDQAEMLDKAIVWRSNRELLHGTGFTHSVQVMADGKPVIVFYDNQTGGQRAWLTAGRWNGRSWDFTRLTQEYGLLDSEKTGPHTLRVYTTRGSEPGITAFTLDRGRNWRQGQYIWTDTKLQKGNVIEGGKDPVRMLAETNTGTQDQTVQTGNVYAVGEIR
ncbi:BNR-4 repeat-containing protein [Nonomuraea sp. NPDC059007]|uniref:BNR-4 repeat-containing protein n=1 Tax=Nonomuraea sp. NPDC059007 TaxID=3346692 RepID=UPI0036930547